jgi:hypothetical protein
MNQDERLRGDLLNRFPGLFAEIDEPADHRSSWFLDSRIRFLISAVLSRGMSPAPLTP